MTDYIEHRVKTKIESGVKKAFKIVFIIIAAIVFILLFGYVTMRLWNWLMPDIFGLGLINYWQAIGIIVLAKILFGGFGGHKSSKRTKKSIERCKPGYKKALKNDFSNWKYYDKFWEEEGENAYNEYVTRKKEGEEQQ